MGLTVADICATTDDEALFEMLSNALNAQFPAEMQQDPERMLATLSVAPQGLRAMASTYELDVSMTLDDLAWHFLNHQDERFLQETLDGLRELEAHEAAEAFNSAWEIVRPFLPEIRANDWDKIEPHDYLDNTGLQSKIDPLSEKLWRICKECGERGLLQYWIRYARKYPEKCASGT